MNLVAWLIGGWCWTIGVIVLVRLGYSLTQKITRAPWLDIVLSLMSWIPWVIGAWRGSWTGLLGVLLGQFAALQTFCLIHSALHPRHAGVIRRTLDGFVGPIRNHLGLWITLPALPVFLSIRVAELFFYPLLVWVLGFPRYRMGDWVNVSRQKFEGLVGHDLVWCLYCDWMTGVYSLGAEMLRNVESFWCPIRFYEGKKCENCRMDFPDIDEWVDPNGSMKDVRTALKAHYSPRKGTRRSWWGHPDREE